MNRVALLFALFLSVGCGERPPEAEKAVDEKKDERPVSPERLAALIHEANRIVVAESPMKDAETLFESSERRDLDALSKAMEVTKPDEWFHCMCIGTPALYLYRDGELLAEITNHHGQAVRCSLWDSDAPIVNIENWLKWFDDRQIGGPRKEVERMRVSRDKGKSDWSKWLAAIPEGLEPVWEASLGQFGAVDVEPLLKALRASVPREEDQILALLAWFGSGAGPWSGFPSYESAAEELLLEYPIKDIVSAIDITKLTPAQIEGTARLFGGWQFSQKYPNGLEHVPDEIKLALWNQVKGTTNKDKLGRAQRAFRPKG